ncbi:MAG: amidohydrolase [Thermoprotei archaeon]|nr:MAG: amidohydrolase [Thermoprotei archaeon]
MTTLAVVGGKILEGFDERGEPIWHEGMLVEDGRVTYLGPHPVERGGPGVRVLDLDGRVVLPGLADAHIHLLGLGASASMLDLRNVESIEELKRLVAERAAELEEGEWILGRGWDQERFKEGKWPTRWDLDEAAPLNPVLLIRVCGHVAVANSLALRLAGITSSTPDPPGGVIDREEGRITGILRESAISLVADKAREAPARRALERAFKSLVSAGITSVHAMSVSVRELRALAELSAEGAVPIRVRAYVVPEAVSEAQLVSESPYLKVVGLKVVMDGSFGARTAALREPYSDDPDNCGLLLLDRGRLKAIIRLAERAGLQLAAHAIGDRALEELLSAVRAGEWDVSVRVEHASLTPPDLLSEMEELGLGVAAQPRFIISDWWVVRRLGAERCKWVYAFRSILSRGLILAFSSDAPVEPHSPWEGVYAATTRGRYEGVELAKVSPGEVVTVKEAIYAYTEAPARLLGEKLGRLSTGYPADFVILDGDPFETPPPRLRRMRVLETYVGGVRVWGSASPPRPHTSA